MSTKQPLPVNRIGHWPPQQLDESGPTWMVGNEPNRPVTVVYRKPDLWACVTWALAAFLAGSFAGGFWMACVWLGGF